MPPKAGRKRARESTGTTVAKAATASSSAPGSAPPASRRTRSNSNASQQEEDGGAADAPATKKSRRGVAADCDAADDVDMGEPGVANGGSRTAAAAGGAAAKKGSRRKSVGAVSANGETATQPATKRGRKSTSSAAAAAEAAASTAPRSRVPEGPAPIANGRAAEGRPPLAAAAAASRTPARGAGPSGRGSVVAGVAGAGAPSSEGGRKAAPPVANANGNAAAATGAAAAAAAPAAEQAAAQQARAGAQATPSGASSPVPAARLRRVTGPGSTNGDDDDGGDGGGSGGGAGAGEGQPGREGGPVGTRWRAAASRCKEAWAAVCNKCLPRDVSAVLPVVQRLTLRCLLLLCLLLGAHAVWIATLWVARGSGTPGGGGGGGGVSRRQAALSLVRKREDFRSLEDVLAKRRRYLKELAAQDSEEQETLKKLRVFVENLDGQIELLREQAAGGLASRGAPEDPEASEAAALSQLEEVGLMQEQLVALVETTSNAIEEGQQWIASAKEDLEALASPPPRLAQLSKEEREGLEAEAEEEWASVFAAPLERAFLDLEDVHVAVQRITAMAEAKPGAEEVAALVRLVEEARRAAAAAAGEEGRSKQKELIREIAEREVAMKWGEEGDGTSSSGIAAPQVLRTAEEAEELVAREVEMFSSGGTGMPDHASLTPGGSVVYGSARLPPAAGGESGDESGDEIEGPLTSPTLASTNLPWADYMLHMLRVPGRVFAEKADAALSSSNSLGSCFAFQGGEGRLTVRLAPPPMSSAAPPSARSLSPASGRGRGGAVAARTRGLVRVTHVSIEHARTALAPTVARSAPRAFRVLGWDADPTGAAPSAASAAGGGGGGGEGAKGGSHAGDGAPPRPYVLLEGAEYQAGGGALAVQTFEVSEAGWELAPPVGWVTLEVQSNHGGKWTCLYGFRVHGDPVS